MLGGSIAPIVGTLLVSYTGTAAFVAGYAIVMAIPALIAVANSRESRGQDFAFSPTSDEKTVVRPTAGTHPTRAS